MKARVGKLSCGTRFVTTLTGRGGTIRAHNGPETRVKFEDRDDEQGIAAEIVVRVEEYLH